MQQLVILLLISCSSTCFGRLYVHPQEVILRFHCMWLSVLLWLLWCWRVGWQAVCTVWSRLQATYSTHSRNTLRNNWLTIKSLIVASSWSHIYLPFKLMFQTSRLRSLKRSMLSALLSSATFIRTTDISVRMSSYKVFRYLCPVLTYIGMCPQTSVVIPKSRRVGVALICVDGQSDMWKLIVAYRSRFTNAL